MLIILNVAPTFWILSTEWFFFVDKYLGKFGKIDGTVFSFNFGL